jgi:hypothetical protein
MQRLQRQGRDPNPKVLTNVLTDQLEAHEMDAIIQNIADYYEVPAGQEEITPDEVRERLGESGNTVTIYYDNANRIDRIEFGNTAPRQGGRSRLNKKTRRAKGWRRHSVRRKLRNLSSRRR